MNDHSKEFDEGFRAYHSGCRMEANHYCRVEEPDQRDSWAAGWLHADYLSTPQTEPFSAKELAEQYAVTGEVVA